MGLVTKRRDNADIVKVVVGGIIDQILNKRNPAGAANLTKTILKRTIENKYGIDKFILSKTLRDKDTYKDWTRMVHVVLADRMAQRDPGNKPQSNDRIPFAYICNEDKKALQGDRIETPDYIREKKLLPDYKYYIEHQLEKPIGQLFGLIVEQIPGYIRPTREISDGEQDVLASELLFKKALQECDKLSRAAFVGRFGGVVTPTQHNFGGNILVSPQTQTQERRSPRLLEKEPSTKQTVINDYFLNKAIVDQFKESKTKAKSNLKKDSEDKKKKK